MGTRHVSRSHVTPCELCAFDLELCLGTSRLSEMVHWKDVQKQSSNQRMVPLQSYKISCVEEIRPLELSRIGLP
jgi:hypothetical protein